MRWSHISIVCGPTLLLAACHMNSPRDKPSFRELLTLVDRGDTLFARKEYGAAVRAYRIAGRTLSDLQQFEHFEDDPAYRRTMQLYLNQRAFIRAKLDLALIAEQVEILRIAQAPTVTDTLR